MSQPPALKRPRVALDEDAERKVLLDHPTLYYDDGNVILSSGSTLFRAHKSILSKHSPVLRVLFDRREDTKTETLRGCLHVALDDTKEEVEALLNVIYDGFRIDFPELTVVTFPVLANIFRMATKYRIGRARADILERIKEEWPFDLAKHDEKQNAKTQAALRRKQEQQEQQRQAMAGAPGALGGAQLDAAILLEQEELAVPPAAVITLLRDGGCADKEILAPLFYALSCSTWQLALGALGHRISQLPHADIERFITGLEHVRSAFASLAVASPPLNALQPHQGWESCQNGMLRFRQSSMLSLLLVEHAATARRPLEALNAVVALVRQPGHLATYGICAACANQVLADLSRRRSDLWNQMPTHFGLV
ncbi:hypothetical protein DAEQUDRAFT_814595 [Daedalea quercina L-15889]|uniref:BTB domain-containing protein n=1 Tax=Daedalea quercina L-15889 TaxID=1314783 RepID=A0A165LXI7_9APHY|nr:hypothetical protein DAEQUDRAFT_814595 [Daedalea quercina L-15889]